MTGVPLLSSIGLVTLAVAACSGWVLELHHRRPELLTRVGVVRMLPLRQTHLDWLMMSLVLFAIDTVVPDRPAWITACIAYGSIINPLLFLPLAFKGPGNDRFPIQVAMLSSFGALTVAYPALAIYALA